MIHTDTTTRLASNERVNDRARIEDRYRERFRKDVIEGLTATEKWLPSKYFYDSTGDRLFQQIMASPDYYVTRCEAEIFRTQNSAMTRALADGMRNFDVIELGAGDGTKTMRLLKKWISRDQQPVYRPVDISLNALRTLTRSISHDLPGLQMVPVMGEYADALEKIPTNTGVHKVFLFLGSNIGNLDRTAAVHLLRTIAARMESDDRSLVGFDLKKDPRVIRRAYDDRAGITRQFNLNLLHRINKELGADIHLDRFMHEPVYDPGQGRALSYLVSTEDQYVNIPGAAAPIAIARWEAIHTETSHKYDMPLIEAMAKDAGLRILDSFSDKKQYFADVVFGLG